MYLALVVAASAAVVLGLAGSTAASRAPTASEGPAIRAAVERFVAKPGPPAAGSVLRLDDLLGATICSCY